MFLAIFKILNVQSVLVLLKFMAVLAHSPRTRNTSLTSHLPILLLCCASPYLLFQLPLKFHTGHLFILFSLSWNWNIVLLSPFRNWTVVLIIFSAFSNTALLNWPTRPSWYYPILIHRYCANIRYYKLFWIPMCLWLIYIHVHNSLRTWNIRLLWLKRKPNRSLAFVVTLLGQLGKVSFMLWSSIAGVQSITMKIILISIFINLDLPLLIQMTQIAQSISLPLILIGSWHGVILIIVKPMRLSFHFAVSRRVLSFSYLLNLAAR